MNQQDAKTQMMSGMEPIQQACELNRTVQGWRDLNKHNIAHIEEIVGKAQDLIEAIRRGDGCKIEDLEDCPFADLVAIMGEAMRIAFHLPIETERNYIVNRISAINAERLF